VALLSAGTLLLAGCSGDGDGDGAGGITGADNGKDGSPEPTDDSTGNAGEPVDDGRDIDRPAVELPAEVTTVFDGWESEDPQEQAILNDAREQVNATVLAVTERDPDAAYLSFYSTGMALVNNQQWVQGFIDNERDIAGTARYHTPELTVRDDGFVALNYCADMSEAITLDARTGEEIESTADNQEYAYATVLEENGEGLWVTGELTFQQKECGS
jgi:hypothetical protein